MSVGFVSLAEVLEGMIDKRGRGGRKMKKKTREIETRVLEGDWKVIWQAEVFWGEDGQEAAEKYLRGRGVMNEG